jgi:CHAT domain-containing protein
MGLSRAFLEAGARTVVGTLWSIRDDHAARFFGWFYRELSRGETVGAALNTARRAAIEAGLPASVWSSVIAIGDGRLAIAGPIGSTISWTTPVAVLGSVGLFVAIVAGRLRVRRRLARDPATAPRSVEKRGKAPEYRDVGRL